MIYGPEAVGLSYVTTCAEENLQRSQATGPDKCHTWITAAKINNNVLPEPSDGPS